MKKALITGVTGFAGSFLAENLIAAGNYEVFGTYLTEQSLVNIESVKDKVRLSKVDLQNSSATSELVNSVSPDVIFHLAALASAAQSFENPSEFINNNVSAEVNILEGIRTAKIRPTTLIISSAEVYGAASAENLPTNEDAPLLPNNPYAVSKVAQDFLGLQYFLSYKIPIVRVRPYNHIGPRQSPGFVVASFAKRIAEIEKGNAEPVLKVGNLTARRDFTDVRDVAEAYRLLLEKGEPGAVYNLGSGKSYLISEILDKLLSFSNKQIKVEQDDTLLRPVDVPELLCDNSKIKAATGWEPKIDIDQTLSETLEYWRSQI